MSGLPRFSLTVNFAPVAQLVEQRTLNPRVQGSSPCGRTIKSVSGGGYNIPRPNGGRRKDRKI